MNTCIENVGTQASDNKKEYFNLKDNKLDVFMRVYKLMIQQGKLSAACVNGERVEDVG